ncbi:16304_t:CDS:2 [Entrophospora sp. SA101]|nr:10189_t:CDS:2 [Entrophospora sp. SA101]CAJ0645398.1 16156_t:CDS:2 [Entrophospora sp. SA101]CAJ0747295.1 16304_t:CDS:2 [Entrophospora sp. SA101]CAJ0828219.1 11468_t:CDS:2 [Entrophospora sp. SA101]CAJ0828260.1 16013_t:CDS:2 [Entrophospora sp. SA101]
MSSKLAITLGTVFASISFVFLLLVNLGTNVIRSIYVMQYAASNITAQLGIYGSCVGSNFTGPLHPEILLGCAKSGLINEIGTSGTKFLAAMHLVALIVSTLLVIVGFIAICVPNILMQTILATISIFGSIVIILAIIGDILVFKDNENAEILIGELDDSISSKNFGVGFGLTIGALACTLIAIVLFIKSLHKTKKVTNVKA